MAFTVKIIIKKVFDYWEQSKHASNKKYPVFFMRSVRNYTDAIDSFLQKNEVKFGNKKITSFQDLIDNEIGSGKHLFFELPQSGSMIHSGVRLLPNTKEIKALDLVYTQAIKSALDQTQN